MRKTIYETAREGLTRSQWKRLKKRLRRHAVDWFELMTEKEIKRTLREIGR